MPPKTDLPAGKRALVLSYFRTTLVAHTLKDLEKALPSAAGISGMLVKDYLAALVNDSELTVEKIGSGNWYWSFPADAVRQKQGLLAEAKKERDKAAAMLEGLVKAVGEEEGRLGGGGDRGGLVERVALLERERERLRAEIEALKGAAGAEVVMGEGEKLKMAANELVDNIYAVEKFLKDAMQGDNEKFEAVRQQAGLEDEIDYIE